MCEREKCNEIRLLKTFSQAFCLFYHSVAKSVTMKTRAKVFLDSAQQHYTVNLHKGRKELGEKDFERE